MTAARFSFLLSVSTVLATAVTPGQARACSPPIMSPFKTEAASLGPPDVQAPTRPRIADVAIYRLKDLGTCGSFGVVKIDLADVSDDRTIPQQLGYQIDVRSGSLPPSVRRIDGVPQFFGSPTLEIHMGFEEAETVDFEFTVTLVDKAGNRGSASEPARAHFPDCTRRLLPPYTVQSYAVMEDCSIEGSGCSVSPGPARTPPAVLAPLIAALTLLALRRRSHGRGRRGGSGRDARACRESTPEHPRGPGALD